MYVCKIFVFISLEFNIITQKQTYWQATDIKDIQIIYKETVRPIKFNSQCHFDFETA